MNSEPENIPNVDIKEDNDSIKHIRHIGTENTESQSSILNNKLHS